MPQGQLAKCNLRSIASATGIHRETVRRKVSKLQLSGILFADPVDGIRVTPSFAAREEVSRVVESQVDALARATSLLRAAGVFDVP
jgi:DNA-binding IclR family transcriptional regulator